jgi:hypothetical protein
VKTRNIKFYLLKKEHDIETTASVLAATLGYLSIYQEEQEKAYNELLDRLTRFGNLVRDNRYISLLLYMLTKTGTQEH